MENIEKSYSNHMLATKELHEAQMRMLTARRAIRWLKEEAGATADAAKATVLFDCKRKAAAAAADDLNTTSRFLGSRCGAEAADVHTQSTMQFRRSPPSQSRLPTTSIRRLVSAVATKWRAMRGPLKWRAVHVPLQWRAVRVPLQ
jgi:hypothetical protein